MNAADDDVFPFASEDPAPEPDATGADPWPVLVVDDDPQVHAVTTLALEGLRIDGRPLAFDHAHSGAEAREKLEAHAYALVLLDVVMAADDEGLEVARWLRDDKNEKLTRIVLRTGQPGLSPERDVMLAYDINDYQPKAELSSQRLATSVIGAIRSYRDLHTIREQRFGLEKLLLATAELFGRRTTEALAAGLLEQLGAFVGPNESAMVLRAEDDPTGEPLMVVAATGRFERSIGEDGEDPLDAFDPDHRHALAELLAARRSGSGDGWSLRSLGPRGDASEGIVGLYLEPARALDPWRARLLDLFCANAGVAFDNVRRMESSAS